MDVSLTDFAARLAPAGTLAIEWTGVVLSLLVLVFLLVSLVLILVVLIQRPQGGGLSAAFGAGGGGQTAFGSKTGDALTLFTIGAFVAFVGLAIGLNFLLRPSEAPVVDPAALPASETAPGVEPEPPLIDAEDAGDSGVESLVEPAPGSAGSGAGSDEGEDGGL